MRAIRPSRSVKRLKIWPSSGSPATSVLLEPPAEGLDHLLASVADPVLAQPLPGDLGIEQCRRGVDVAAPEGAEEVDHDRLEVLLADACHRLLLGREQIVTADRSSRKEAFGATATSARRAGRGLRALYRQPGTGRFYDEGTVCEVLLARNSRFVPAETRIVPEARRRESRWVRSCRPKAMRATACSSGSVGVARFVIGSLTRSCTRRTVTARAVARRPAPPSSRLPVSSGRSSKSRTARMRSLSSERKT